MKYIKNLEDQILTESLADDAAEVSGLDSDAVNKAVSALDFADYLELGNAVKVEDADRIREILNISDVVPAEPIGEIDLEEENDHPEDQFPHDPTMLCSLCGSQGYDRNGNTCTACGGQGRVTLDGEYIDEDRYEDETEECIVCSQPGWMSGKDLWGDTCYHCGGKGRVTKDGDYIDNEFENSLEEADNPSAPATAAPAPPAATPPSAGSSIDNLAKPVDTAEPHDDEEELQGRKEIADLQVGDEVEVADIDGQPAAGRVRNMHGPGNTIVITGKGNEEHIIRKDSILSTPLIPVQEKQQSRLDKTNLGKKNKRAERVKNKKQKDVYENDDYWAEVAKSDAKIAEYGLREFGNLGFKRSSNWPGGTTLVAKGDLRKLVRAKFREEGWTKMEPDARISWYSHPTLPHQSVVEYDRGRTTVSSMLPYDAVSEEYEINVDAMREAYEDALNEVAPPGMEDWITKRKPEFKKRYGDRWEEVLYATAWQQKNNEGLEEGINFFVDPLSNGKFNVMSSKGDIHDTYENGIAARKAAEKLNAQYGEIDENSGMQPLHIGSDIPFPNSSGGHVVGFINDMPYKGRVAKVKFYNASGNGSRDFFYKSVDDHNVIVPEDADLQRIKELAGINEVKSGNFNSKMIGQRVKIMAVNSFGVDHIGEEGVIHRASREHTFSQMVPFVIEYGVTLDSGEKITIRRESVRKIKQIAEARRGNETNKEEMTRLKRELNRTQDKHRRDYLRLEIRKLQGEIDLRKERAVNETASGGSTGAGAIASSPVAMNGMQSRNQSIYGQTTLRKKPTPKKRPTKEAKDDGIGRKKKD